MIEVPVSVGEVLDKISILEIKSERIADSEKLANVLKELDHLKCAAQDYRVPNLEASLKYINEQLWVVEDELRLMEKQKDFGLNFVCLARSVYTLNDERAAIKKQINLLTNSGLIEEKSYTTLGV